mmetsp:Transcript_19561/g.31054  ORF Transcript_19561/g.31054 Transcript_19561/m.31054 type:complete len:87 (-) Transcript_19561:116-376(-)
MGLEWIEFIKFEATKRTSTLHINKILGKLKIVIPSPWSEWSKSAFSNFLALRSWRTLLCSCQIPSRIIFSKFYSDLQPSQKNDLSE